MKVKVHRTCVFGWTADCNCGDHLFCGDWPAAMVWAWGHLAFTHQGESHRPPDWVDPWAEDNVLSF